MDFQNVTFELAAGRKDQLPKAGVPEIVFSGKSNVGKSSLINKLVNRKALARVSATPGKTATINFYRLPDCRLVDLPGYGYAKVSQKEKASWGRLISGYFSQQRDVRLVFALVDMRHPPSKEDVQMLNFLIDGEYPFVVALTKADKLTKSQRAERLAALGEEIPCGDQVTLVPCSAQNGEGVDTLKAMIEDVVQD